MQRRELTPASLSKCVSTFSAWVEIVGGLCPEQGTSLLGGLIAAVAPLPFDHKAIEVGIEPIGADEREGQRAEIVGFSVGDTSAVTADQMTMGGDRPGVVHRAAVGEVDVVDHTEMPVDHRPKAESDFGPRLRQPTPGPPTGCVRCDLRSSRSSTA